MEMRHNIKGLSRSDCWETEFDIIMMWHLFLVCFVLHGNQLHFSIIVWQYTKLYRYILPQQRSKMHECTFLINNEVVRYKQFFTGGNVEFADELVDDFVSRYIAHLAVLWWRHLVSSLKIHRDHVRCFYRGISQSSVSMVMNNSLKHKQCNVTLNNVQFSYFYFFKQYIFQINVYVRRAILLGISPRICSSFFIPAF